MTVRANARHNLQCRAPASPCRGTSGRALSWKDALVGPAQLPRARITAAAHENCWPRRPQPKNDQLLLTS